MEVQSSNFYAHEVPGKWLRPWVKRILYGRNGDVQNAWKKWNNYQHQIGNLCPTFQETTIFYDLVGLL